MGFLDSVRGAIKDAMSSQSSRDAAAARKLAQQAEGQPDNQPDNQPDEQAADPDSAQDVAEPAVVEYDNYTVRVGDSMPEIGSRFGVSAQEIARANEIDNPDLIFPGQVFRIPKS